ncbi:hypothetical protein [Nicoliella lavandulae]|uniref:Uncharacterized protein n=1 Tax=Nicoliella lavandulae TaxID=3082954 RepID=A0ABU8SM72_9LACO
MDYKKILEDEIKKLQNGNYFEENQQFQASSTILEIVKYLNSEKEKKDRSLNAATIQKQVNDVLDKRFKEAEKHLFGEKDSDLEKIQKEKQWLIKYLGKDKLNELTAALDKFRNDNKVDHLTLKEVVNFEYHCLLLPSTRD